MKAIDDNELKITALRALHGNTPQNLTAFSLEFEPRTGNLTCLAVFSSNPTEEDIDNVSSTIAEVEAAWPEIRSTTDKYLATKEAASLSPLRIEVFKK